MRPARDYHADPARAPRPPPSGRAALESRWDVAMRPRLGILAAVAIAAVPAVSPAQKPQAKVQSAY
jgi:hypothetical protein